MGTDAKSFNLAGVPASGVLTGQDCCKTQQEVDMFGGFTGNYEGNVPSIDGGCVDNPFLWCDNLANNDKNVHDVRVQGVRRQHGTDGVRQVGDMGRQHRRPQQGAGEREGEREGKAKVKLRPTARRGSSLR